MRTNHDRFVQVFRDRDGRVFSTKQIVALMKSHSDIAQGSILPNDHAEGNKSACWCARTNARIFDRIGRARYRVRPNAGFNVAADAPVNEVSRANNIRSDEQLRPRIAELWSGTNETEWKDALDKYWSFVKLENLVLEKELNTLSLQVKAPSDMGDWYNFLLYKYFPWKYTDPRYSPQRYFVQEYGKEESAKHILNEIIERLFAFDRLDIKRGLFIGTEIKGLGVAGASGLLSLLFPNHFGTIDSFDVKALQKVKTLPEIEELRKMNPRSLTVLNGVVLIQIMRRKANELNSLFCSTF